MPLWLSLTRIGYPLIIRPAFTLGGSGGGIASSEEEFIEIAENGLQILAYPPDTRREVHSGLEGNRV